MSLPAHIQAYLDSDEFKREKVEFDAWSARVDALATPLIEEAKPSWRKLEFTEEAMEIQGGDPDIAFQGECGDWIVRADYSGEIGDSSWCWRKGSEDEATQEWGDDFFAHGTPTEPPTAEEWEAYGWIMEHAIRGHVIRTMMDQEED